MEAVKSVKGICRLWDTLSGETNVEMYFKIMGCARLTRVPPRCFYFAFWDIPLTIT